MKRSYVVTGGGQGIGRAIALRLASTGASVQVLERDDRATEWIETLHRDLNIELLIGDASDDTAAEEASARASADATLQGWVNNAARFEDAWLHETDSTRVRTLIDYPFDARSGRVEGSYPLHAGTPHCR